MFENDRRQLRIQNPDTEPREDDISEMKQILNSIPSIDDDDDKLNAVESIFLFVHRFNYDFYRSLSPEEVSILTGLLPYQSTKFGSHISYRTVHLFTFLIENDPKLFDEFIKLDLIQLLIPNMINTTDMRYHINCLAFLYELLKINNELRDEYISYNLPDLIMNSYSPFPDKIFFEFLTLLAIKPSLLPDHSLKIIQSFISQDVPQERAITVIQCLISFIQADESLLNPILSSNFLEKIVSSLGSVTHTIAMFLKFCLIAIQINQSDILETFSKINIFDILQSSLELIASKKISFSDMLISSLEADKSSGDNVVSANDNLLMQSSDLMNALLQYDICLPNMEFVSDFDFESTISEKLPYKTLEATIRFLLNYSIRMPNSIAKKVLTENIIRNAFFMASLSDDVVDTDCEFVAALSAISSKFADDEEITNFITNANIEYDNVVIE